MKDFNLRCDDLKNNIVNIINNSELPIAVIYYIFQVIYYQIQKNYYGIINKAKLKQPGELHSSLQEPAPIEQIVEEEK